MPAGLLPRAAGAGFVLDPLRLPSFILRRNGGAQTVMGEFAVMMNASPATAGRPPGGTPGCYDLPRRSPLSSRARSSY